MRMTHFIHNMVLKLTLLYEFIDRKIIFPFCRKAVTILTVRCEKRIAKYGMTSDWKEQTLRDFSFWLSDLPDDRTFQHPPVVDNCDLFTLLSEFSGLRQEIRFQNREQSKSVKTVNSFIDSYQETFELLKQHSSHLKQLEANVSRSAEKRSLSHFFDVRDTLVRGAEAIRKQKAAKGFFGRGKRELENILESYEIAIRKFDRAMAFSGIIPVETVGRPFDPKIMRAVSVTDGKGDQASAEVEKEIVVEQVCGGFLREKEVLRYAEVVVKKQLQ